MDKISYKRVADSRTEQVQIIMPEHINGDKRLFGGRLMEWIDIVAAVVARRHSGCNVTTASIDNLQFKAAAYINNTIFLTGQITYVGRSSMEVRVTTYVENMDGKRHMINRAYLVLVALDDKNQPVKVPGICLETDEERLEWEAGEKRSQLRKQRRLEAY